MAVQFSDRPRRPGWTLPEVLVVLFVLSVLFALLVPAIQRARESANRITCANNLRQLALATHACHDATGALPPYSTGQPGTSIFGGWWIHLLPYASESPFYDELINASTDKVVGGGTLSTMVVSEPRFRARRFPLLTCASDPSLGSAFIAGGTSNYLANWFVFGDGIGCYGPAQKLNRLDSGFSNAVLFAEGYSTCSGLTREALVACATHNFGITWHAKPSDHASYLPENYMMFQAMPRIGGVGGCDSLRAQTPHVNMPVAFADGSVRFIDPAITLNAWTRLMKPRD